MNNKYCYLTFLTNSKYIPGLIALIRSLKRVKSKYSLVVCIPAENISLMNAIEQNSIFRNIIIIRKPLITLPSSLKTFEHWKESFFKLTAASFVEYDRIVILDCDMLVCKNIDHLFDYPSCSAVQDVENINNPYEKSSRFNSGLLVLEPNMETYHKLCENISIVVQQRNSLDLAVGDQDVFNYTFNKWNLSTNCHLAEKYNIQWPCFPKYEKDGHILSKDAFIIHFIGPSKPWQDSKKAVFRTLTDLLLDGKHFRLMFLYCLYLWLCR